MADQTTNNEKEDLSTKVWVRTLTLEMASARLDQELAAKCTIDDKNNDENADGNGTDKKKKPWAWALARLLSGEINHSASSTPPAPQDVSKSDSVSGVVVKVQDDSSIYNGQTIEIPAGLLFSNAVDLDNKSNLKKSALTKSGVKKFGASTSSTVSSSFGSTSSATSKSGVGTNKTTKKGDKIPNIFMANPSDCTTNTATTSSNSHKVPHDLQSLNHLNEPSVLHTLSSRYRDDFIYTSTGPQILVALNPFKATNLYEEEMLTKYAELGEWEQNFGPSNYNHNLSSTTTMERESSFPNPDPTMPPHVFRIADNAFRAMMKALYADTMDHAGLGVFDPLAEDSETSVPRASFKGGSGSGSGGNEDGGMSTMNSVIVNQSLLVSGESGSGKTVTTKHCLRYLASLSQRRGKANMGVVSKGTPATASSNPAYQPAKSLRNLVKAPSSRNMGGLNHHPSSKGLRRRSSVKRGSGFSAIGSINAMKIAEVSRPTVDRQASWVLGSEIEVKILEANPILEAFGNARTVRNDNSSRFGKYIELFFSPRGSLIGATIETYLLEKVRLIHSEKGERNYHIFYEIMDGASEEELKEYLLDGYEKEDFKIINQSGTMDRRDGVDDQDEFDSLIESMALLQFDPDQIRDIMRISVACMHALNITFTAPSADESDLDDSNPHLQKFLTLMGVERNELRDTICFYELLIGGRDKQRKNQTKANAEKGMEGFIKSIYSAMFTHLVNTINQRIQLKASASSKHAASIGILDIFGFESFQINSFEQLMINYCNEALQQLFNGVVFKSIKEEYDSEGIDSSFISFPDNQDALDCIDKKGVSVFSILDDMSFAPGTNDEKFVNNLYQRMDPKSTRFVANSLHQGKRKFVINHYAGNVEYSTEKWIEKNKDEVPRAMVKLLESSSNGFVKLLASVLDDQDEKNAPSGGLAASMTRKRTKKTVAKQFSAQLKQLRNKIGKTTPYFVRCIKPNQELTPDNFSHDVVLDQLKSLGVLEAVRVSRSGFSKSYSHEEFIRRYHVLTPRKASKTSVEDSASSRCSLIIDESLPLMIEDVSKEEGIQGIQLGTHRVFLRQSESDTLDRLRSKAMVDATMKIQRCARAWLARNELQRRRNAIYATKIQAQARRLIATRRVQFMLLKVYSATLIQSRHRGIAQRGEFKRMLEEKRQAEKEAEERRRILEQEAAEAKRKLEEEEAAAEAKRKAKAETKCKMEEEGAEAKRRTEKEEKEDAAIAQFADEIPDSAPGSFYAAETEEDIVVLKQKFIEVHGGTILPSLAESVVMSSRLFADKSASNISGQIAEQDSIGRDDAVSRVSTAPSGKKNGALFKRFFGQEGTAFGRKTKAFQSSKRVMHSAEKSRNTAATASVVSAESPSDTYTVHLPVTQHGLLINVTSLHGGAAFSSYRKTPFGDRGPAELNRLFKCRGDKILSINGTDCSRKSYPHIIDMLIKASQDPDKRVCELVMQDWKTVRY